MKLSRSLRALRVASPGKAGSAVFLEVTAMAVCIRGAQRPVEN
jgi:hypothetical protein